MPRPLRVEVPGGVYHLTTRAVEAARLYLDDKDRRQWLRLGAAAVATFRWTCFAYCLLSNHYHLVVRIETPNLAAGMQFLNSRHAQMLNKRYERHGHLFGARYHAEHVRKQSHGLEVFRYVALNPVRAGLSPTAEEWPWSSYAATIGLAPAPAFLVTDWVLGLFATEPDVARRRLRAFVQSGLVQQKARPPSGGQTP